MSQTIFAVVRTLWWWWWWRPWSHWCWPHPAERRTGCVQYCQYFSSSLLKLHFIFHWLIFYIFSNMSSILTIIQDAHQSSHPCHKNVTSRSRSFPFLGLLKFPYGTKKVSEPVSKLATFLSWPFPLDRTGRTHFFTGNSCGTGTEKGSKLV